MPKYRRAKSLINGHDDMGQVAKNSVLVKMQEELKSLVLRESIKLNISMGELFVKFAAEYFGKPDLAAVPRKSFGRPPKKRNLHVGV